MVLILKHKEEKKESTQSLKIRNDYCEIIKKKKENVLPAGNGAVQRERVERRATKPRSLDIIWNSAMLERMVSWKKS